MVFFLSFNVTFCFTKGSEETSYKLGKVFVSHITDKGLQSRIFKEFSSSTEGGVGGGKQTKKQPVQLENGAKMGMDISQKRIYI